MKQLSRKIQHELVSGKITNGCLEKPFWAGDAYYHEDGGYFEVVVSLFNEPWYLSPNKATNTYTIFKERVVEGGKTHFRRPLGRAYFMDGVKNYLRISVPLWNPRYHLFLNLFPML